MHQYFLLYKELSWSINEGDIGHVETLFPSWIYLFRATGKHKYAKHMMKFLTDIHFVYPSKLQHAVWYNILVNPTRKKGKFCAVDWVVEAQNLHTKESWRWTPRTKHLLDLNYRWLLVDKDPITLRRGWSRSCHSSKSTGVVIQIWSATWAYLDLQLPMLSPILQKQSKKWWVIVATIVPTSLLLDVRQHMWFQIWWTRDRIWYI